MAVVLAIAAAAFVAASLRLSSLLATALAGYVALAANLGFATWSLSPLHEVTPNGLALEEAVLLLGAASVWWLRGRPGVRLAPAAAAVREIAGDRVLAAFLLVAGVALGYELLLALAVPPTNWDSLTYHLPRVLAWRQHHGISWIPNAPTARLNEFQPFAEQEILFLFVATGTTAVFALPQFAAEIAILIAVYGASRRLGFGARGSAFAAALLATLSLVALEASTAQNDLVAASFPIVAACLLAGGGSIEAVVAGIAVALGLGTKLTTVLALPVLAWLAWSAGRRTFKLSVAGGVLGLVLAGGWSFVLNVVHTGNPLGHGQGRNEHTVSLSVLGTLRTSAHVLDRLVDVSVLGYWWIAIFAAAGAVAAVVVAARRGGGLLTTAAISLPLAAPAVALALTHIPAGDPAGIERSASQDYSAFGPLGMLALVAAPIAAVIAGRRDRRQLALAVALPSYIVLLALYAKYDIWITRFLVVPAVLTAPLFARLYRSSLATASVLAVAAVTVALTLAHDGSKPLNGRNGLPWHLNQTEAVGEGPAEPTGRWVAATFAAYNQRVPATACVGAVMDPDDFSYLLWGQSLRHRVVFLPSLTALQNAVATNVRYVVISNGANAPVAQQFSAAGWRVEHLATWWLLAVAPPRAGAVCGPTG